MKNRRGFTLIELLAVIALLAIIMIIAIPRILGVIENAEMQAYRESVEIMVKTAKIQYDASEVKNEAIPIPQEGLVYEYSMNGTETIQTDESINTYGLLDFKGDKPSSGTIILTQNKNVIVTNLVSKNQKWCAEKDENENTVRVGKMTESGCSISTRSKYKVTFKYYDGTNVATITSDCTVSIGNSCKVTVPEEVRTSTGKYGSEYKNVSNSTSNISEGSLDITEDTTFYAYYSSPVTIYYPIATVDSSTGALSNLSVGTYSYYRNEFFNSTTEMTAVINSTQTATSNFTFTSSATGYTLRGFANAVNSITRDHTSVTNLALTDKTKVYAFIRKNVTATVYYNSGNGNGTLTLATETASAYRTMYCGSTTAIKMSNANFPISETVNSSVGQYGNNFYGFSQSLSSMTKSRYSGPGPLSSSSGKDTKALYAIYQGNNVNGTKTNVTNYYYNGSSNDTRTLYRNSYFTSVTGNGAMNTILSTEETGTSNYSTEVGPGSSAWRGLSTEQDTTIEYPTVASAAISRDLTLYTVYNTN